MVAAKRLQGEIAIGHLVVGIAIGKRNRLVHHHFAYELRDGLAFVEPLSTDAGERLVGGGLVERDEAGRPAIGEVLMIERIENAGPGGIGKTQYRDGAQMLIAQHRLDPASSEEHTSALQSIMRISYA